MLSSEAARRLRAIKHCGLIIIGFVAGAELLIILENADDPQGGFFMGVLIAFISTVVVTATAVLERTLQNAVDIKSENDLTV
jgi:NADH:ubiquinone oxidoreductase subunit 2 (subunit N)